MDGGENVTNKNYIHDRQPEKRRNELKGQSIADIAPQGDPAPGQVIYVFIHLKCNFLFHTTTTVGSTSTTSETPSGERRQQ